MSTLSLEHVWVAIIAGGQGTRLFPISHTDIPKQFCQLDEKNTFIQAVIENFAGVGIKRNHMIVITKATIKQISRKNRPLPGVFYRKTFCKSNLT